MFIGHSVAAFALVAVLTVLAGYDRETGVRYGCVAGLFALVPDVDMLYALTGLVDGGSLLGVADAFWRASTVVHRGVTHSLVVAVPAAVVFGVVGWSRGVWTVIGGALIVGVGLLSGPLAAVVMTVFVGAGSLVAVLGDRVGIPSQTRFVLAAVGLLTHPFGDLFTGTPPALFYPFEVSVIGARIGPFLDPTLNLLLAFGVELLVIWVGVLTMAWLTDRPVVSAIDRRAGLGVGYGGVVLLITPPTMAGSYQFVFSVLAVGVVGVVPVGRGWERVDWWSTVLTGLAAVSVGGLAYVVAYLGVGA